MADPGLAGDDHPEIIEKFLSASRANRISGIQMEAEVDASLPKLQKKGTLQALRKISKLGKITWDRLHFSGDNTIKKEVIARYIQVEQEQGEEYNPKIAITPENYKFKYRGLADVRNGQKVYVFHLTPRRKQAELFKGEIWLDAQSYLPVREAGTFVKSPSIFLTKVNFARDYQMIEGQAVPKLVESHLETRFWGPAQVTIRFNNVSKSEEEPIPSPGPEQP